MLVLQIGKGNRNEMTVIKQTAMSNGNSSTSGASVEPEYVVPEVLPMDDEGNSTHKIKGAAQIAAGTALTAAGVPMLVLPGPGAVAIAGGAALISKVSVIARVVRQRFRGKTR